ncbi:MAG TPA: rod shape-determining protein MreD [Candidatus Limnocylindria bacterium]
MPEWSGSKAAGPSVYSLPTPSGGHASTSSVPTGEPAISYTSVLLAVVVGIVHAGLSPVIEIGGVRPNLALVGVVLVTTQLGFGTGIVWAFVAGLTANLLVLDPLGSVPLSLLLVAALVAGGDRLLGRLVWVYPIIAALAGSVLADLVSLGVLRLIDAPLQVGVPFDLIVPAAVLNAALVGVLLYPARIATARLRPDERAAW